MTPAPPRIVVLDGHTLGPTDPEDPRAASEAEPSWAGLCELGRLELHARTPPELVQERAEGAPIVLTNKTVLGREQIQRLADLRYIGVLATGTDVVDLETAEPRSIVVTNVPKYATESVVQHVFALILELLARPARYDEAVHAGQWARSPDFALRLFPTTEIAGKTLGIVGLGNIGRRVAEVGHAMGLRIAAWRRTGAAPPRLDGAAVIPLSLDQLFVEADIVSLHCPLTDQTRALVNAERLGRMKPTAILINTGRGALVDESELAASLIEGRLHGAGLDVLSREPPAPDHPLLRAPRCVITPHVAWTTQEARRRLMEQATENVRAYLSGAAVNQVTASGRRR